MRRSTKNRWVRAVLFNLFFWGLMALLVYIFLTRSGEVVIASRVWSETIQISANHVGIVKTIHFDVTQPFEKGQPLFELESPDLDDDIEGLGGRIKNLESQIQQEKTELARALREFGADKEIQAAEQEIKQKQFDLESREKNDLPLAQQGLARAEEKLKQAQYLFDKGALLRSELDAYQIAHISALAARDKILTDIEGLRRAIKTSQEKLGLHTQYKANLTKATDDRIKTLLRDKVDLETQLKNLQNQRERLVHRADRNAYVATRLKNAGERVQLGDPVLEITTGENIWVEAYFPPQEANLVRIGDRLSVRYVDRVFPALVDAVSLAAGPNPLVPATTFTPAADAIMVKLLFAQPSQAKQGGLRPGMRVDTLVTRQEGLLSRLGLKKRDVTAPGGTSPGEQSASPSSR